MSADCPTCAGSFPVLVNTMRRAAEERAAPSREGKWAAARARLDKLAQAGIPAGAAGVGKRIQIGRVLRKMTQRELAKQARVSAQLVVNWESGKSFPGVDDIERVAKIFGMRPAVLMKWPCPLCDGET